ncbi:hypothetical protein MVEG_05017 [Podila verticillata NRRL 6337]|nr:hypothetical protein MVEG_05017 [Podila verticillata NRRL 6337]
MSMESDSDSDDSSSDDDDDPIADLAEEYILAGNSCYLNRPGTYRRQTVNNIETLQRMTELFQSRSNRKQEPVAVQLALALDRLGHFGNGMAITRLSHQWKRSEGSCINITNRVIKALLSLSDQFTAWPSPEFRAGHSRFMSKQGFSGCVGFVDGTTIPLSHHPDEEGDFYYDRHGDYSLSLQVVCAANRWITFGFTGYSGRCHDHAVYTASDIWRYPDEYFSFGEYLVADSAYPISKFCVPVIKGAGLTQDEKDFNRCVAHVRACNEHAIGMLKGRWASLKSLPIRIRKGAARKEEDLLRAVDWIHACIILHNFLIDENDLAEMSDLWCMQHIGNQSPGTPQYEDGCEEHRAGLLFRQRVMENVLRAGRGPTGIVTYEQQHQQ